MQIFKVIAKKQVIAKKGDAWPQWPPLNEPLRVAEKLLWESTENHINTYE